MAQTAPGSGLRRLKWIGALVTVAFLLALLNLALLLVRAPVMAYAITQLIGASALFIAAIVLIPGWNLFDEVEVPAALPRFWKVIIAIGKATFYVGIGVTAILLIASSNFSANPPEPTARLGIGTSSLIYVFLTGFTVTVKDVTGRPANLAAAAFLVAGTAVVLLALRAVLGWLRLVPKSWRKPSK